MNTPLDVEGLLANPQPLPIAANEEFPRYVPTSAGWDPYEVWRTRIKAAKDDGETGGAQR